MSLTASELSCADIAAVMGANRGNDGGFGDMGSGWWLILLFLIFGNGWGNGYGGGNGGAGGLYPWMNQADITNSGFRDQMINDNVTSIRDGIYGLSNQLCSCCGDMRDTVNQGFYSAEIAASNRQMANMNSIFGVQNAINSGFNTTQAQLAQCCCDNRLATCQTQNIIQSESAATRFADAQNTRDIIQNQSNGTQAIIDKLCQLELDNLKQDNANLRTQLNMANLAASQTRQTTDIQNSIISELRSCPIPSQPVYGSQPIFTCPNNNNGCGCGCGCNG